MTGARDKRERVRGAVAEDVDDNTRGHGRTIRASHRAPIVLTVK